MKKVLFLGFFLFNIIFVTAQLYPKNYDKVDYMFDSIYSANYQNYKNKQDSARLQMLYSMIKTSVSNGARDTELLIPNSILSALPKDVFYFKDLEKITFFNCKRLNIDTVIKQLSKFPILTDVAFINCNLYSLPNSIKNLSSLENLDLKENNIVVLPESLTSIQTLKKINVSGNSNMNEDLLFDLVNKAPNLTHINASYCNIRDVPEIAKEHFWEELNLEGNLLKYIPHKLQIKKLNLAKNIYLDKKQLFESLRSIHKLEHLNLSNNKWKDIPENIGTLKHLKVLNLRGNQLTSLPEEIGYLSKLQVLKVDNTEHFLFTNHLESLPSNISYLQDLDSLFLSGNNLSKLPSSFSELKQLKYLDLSWNKFISFPNEILENTNLRYLNLAINHVKSIPESIDKLTALEYLNLSGDFFVNYKLKIKALPISIGNLKELKELYLADNVIEIFPEELLNCSKLRVLDIQDNLLGVLPNNIQKLSGLEHLEIQANELINIPDNLADIKSLDYLDLSMNVTLDTKQSTAVLVKMKQLSNLNVSYCYFSNQDLNLIQNSLPNTSIESKTDE